MRLEQARRRQHRGEILRLADIAGEQHREATWFGRHFGRGSRLLRAEHRLRPARKIPDALAIRRVARDLRNERIGLRENQVAALHRRTAPACRSPKGSRRNARHRSPAASRATGPAPRTPAARLSLPHDRSRNADRDRRGLVRKDRVEPPTAQAPRARAGDALIAKLR